ncbi:hypothetical protein ACJ73_00192 [Blastomyces percursus]|uniref:SP-RING-type domain-containing protein n=1 Tax=Blastomyces percursus TaxID=1658174 RepID=A0A1J9QHT8_9EURO|nr:hypothetical protein ACJ73_00192 [Blastomyces percursus]
MRTPQRPHNRRQSTDGRHSELELTSLNSTLNKFVGTRQKSWMLNVNSPPNPSMPTPAKRPTPAPTPDQSTAIPSQPRGSEMDEESLSTLEPVRQRGSNRTQGQNGPVTPSSEQLPIFPVSPNCPLQPEPAPVLPSASPTISNSLPEQIPQTASTGDRQYTVLLSPGSHHGCSTRAVSESGPGDSSMLGAAPLPPHQSSRPLPGTVLQQRDPSLEAINGMGHSPLSISQTPRTTGNSPVLELDRNKRARIVPGNSAISQPYQTQNAAPANTQSTSDMRNNRHAFLKPPASDQFSWKKFIPTLGRFSAPPGTCENSRIVLLQTACRNEDTFYIVLHQVYCLHTISPGFLPPSKLGARQIAGLEVVSHFLVQNDSLSKPFVEACASFPVRFEIAVQYFSNYLVVCDQVVSFLGAMADRWLPFETSIAMRGYPPLIDELVDVLGLTSPTFRHIIFTACHRRLAGARNDGVAQAYARIFQKNEGFYQQRRLRKHSANPISLAQIQSENEFLKTQYLQIWEQHISLNRTVRGAINYQLPQRNQGAYFPVTGAGNPQPQTQNYVIQRPQQPPIPRAYPQVRSSYSSPAANSSQRPLQRGQKYASAPLPNSGCTTIFSPTHAHAATSGRPMMAPPHSNSLPPISSEFVPLSDNTNIQQRHGAFIHSSVQPSQANCTAAQSFHPKPNNLLLPPAGVPPMEAANPNPLLVGLHQAFLREKIVALNTKDRGSGPSQLFQYLHSFAIPPSSIQIGAPIGKLQFTITPEECQKFPVRLNATDMHSSPVLGVSDGRRTYQLRCIKMNSPSATLSEHQWSVSDTAWPTAIYIHVNGIEHFVRRKPHFGRDLPVNITSSLKEGLNEMSITIIWGAAERNKKATYAMVLEIVEFASLSRIASFIQCQSFSTTLAQIKNRLTGLNTNDDDIAVVDQHITIDLVDPFTARIFNIPARTKFCAHMECFDLETFLMTRLPKLGKGHSMAEDWKCPICGNDARPKSLIMDDFFIAVRRELEEKKQLEVKAILVRPDGSWEPKPEGNNTNNNNNNNIRSSEPRSLKRKREPSEGGWTSSSPNNNDQQHLHSNVSSKQSHAPEVIELD